jgi:hypothetical protein
MAVFSVGPNLKLSLWRVQLVRDLLQRDPEFRPSASEVLLSKLPSLMVQFEKRFRLT